MRAAEGGDVRSLRDILCFAGNDWWVHNPLTEKQWMRDLASRGHRILFVNSIGVGVPSLTTPRLGYRLWLKIKSLARWLRRSDHGVWVLTPVLLPLWSLPPVRTLNVMLITLQVRLVLTMLGFRRPVFWAGLPTAALLHRHIPHDGTVYYIQDNYLAYYDAMRFDAIPRHHHAMLNAADRIICAAAAMHDSVVSEHPQSVYIPHGVHPRFYEIPLEGAHPVPTPLRDLPHPIIGYWGSLEVLQDQDLILLLARTHPEWSLVFIGNPHYDTSRVAALPNVHFLGFIPLEQIPDYGIHFDVTMINWVQNAWVEYSCPVKLREYLALGKPVVTSFIRESQAAFPEFVRVAHSHDEFLHHVEDAVAEDTPERRARRRERVLSETWSWSAGQVHDLIQSLRTF